VDEGMFSMQLELELDSSRMSFSIRKVLKVEGNERMKYFSSDHVSIDIQPRGKMVE